MKSQKKRSVYSMLLSLVLVFIFMTIASGFNSDWGNVTVRDVYYPSSEGTILHGQLFVPKGVSSSNPAPAILNMHGGSDYLQTVSNYTLELARRGYVVLSVDAYGSGSSDFISNKVSSTKDSPGQNNSALKMDGGVSTGIEQLMSYKFVDQNNIGMTGHSMGGTFVANAALEHADHVKAIMPWGSGSFIDKIKNSSSSDFTFNVGYINAICDESVYSVLKAETSTLLKDDLLKNFFGTTEDIVAGKVYGDFDSGTARVIYTPYTTHIGNIINRDSIGSMISFFEQAIPTGSSLSSSSQVWMFKELFCVLAIVSLVAFIISVGFLMLESPVFSAVNVTVEPPAISSSKRNRILGIIICTAIPALTLYHGGAMLSKISPNAVFPMNWANSLAGLAVVNAAIILVIFLIWHFAYGKDHGSSLIAYGFADDENKISLLHIVKSVAFSIALITIAYMLINFCYAKFKIDFRFWQFGIMPITLKRFSCIFGYLLCYLFAFGVMNTVSIAFAGIGSNGGKAGVIKQYLLGWLIGAGGYTFLMIFYYTGLKINHYPPFISVLPIFSQIFSMKTTCLVPTFTILSVINTALYRKTKNTYVGWFTAAIFAAMILISSNAFAV